MSLLNDASLILTPNAFKASKLYSIVPSNGNGDMTIVRATTATRVNSSGLIETVSSNVPRVDYSDGGCPSILLEPQRTNLSTASQAFDGVQWLKTGTATVTANTTISPSGVQDADTLLNATGALVWATGNGIQQQQTTTGSTTITLTVYVKSLGVATTFSAGLRDNTTSGIIQSTTIAIDSTWKRLSFTYTTGALQVSTGILFGNTNGSVAIWGAQLEVGAYATSYIATTTAAVTRNADTVTRNNIFTNGLITSAGGTWFIDQSSNQFIGGNGLEYCIYLTAVGTASLVIAINTNNTLNFYKWTNSVQNISQTIAGSNLARTKVIVRWNASTGVIDLFLNGVLKNTFTSQTFVNYENLSLTDANGGSTQSAHKVNSCMLFPTVLTDTQCVQLTT